MTDTLIETIPETGETAPVFHSVYFPGGALKAVGDGRVGGYLVVFTNTDDRDSYNEYFTARTDYGLDYYRNQPVLYHHGQNDELVTPIGMIDTLRMTDYGVYAEAKLDIGADDPTVRQYAQMAYQQTNAGKLFWSSGSADHLVRVTDDGEIIQWYIVEGSLTPKPAEQRGRTHVEVLRAAIRALMDEQETIEQEPETAATEPIAVIEPDVTVSPTPTIRIRKKHMSMKMDMASVMSVLDGVGELSPELKWQIATAMASAEAGEEAGESPVMADEAPAVPPEQEQPPVAAARSDAPVDANQIAAIVLKQMRLTPAKGLPAGGGQKPNEERIPQIEVRTKYHDLSVEDMAYLAEWNRLKAFREARMYLPEPAFVREMIEKGQKEYRNGGLKGVDRHAGAKFMAVRSNELDNTAAAGAALEWVPTLWSSDFWRRIRVDNNVASAFPSVEMPSNVFELPIQSTDPTVYKVPETTGEAQLALDNSSNPIPDSLVSSGKKTLTAAKLGLRVGFSTEMEEDSIIPFIAETREQGVRSMENAVDNVFLNGDTDTTASTNINNIDGSPAATDKFLVFNGLRKLALVTNTTVSLNAGGAAPTLQLIRQLRFKMQSALNVYALYPDNLVMFCDPYTYGKVLNIDEINVWMNNGREATVNTGQVKALDGVPIFPSQELGLANTAGKISGTASNNTTGTIIIAARSGWRIGYRRQITTSVDFLPYYDSYQFTATMRLAFINKDTVASAVMYNVGI